MPVRATWFAPAPGDDRLPTPSIGPYGGLADDPESAYRSAQSVSRTALPQSDGVSRAALAISERVPESRIACEGRHWTSLVCVRRSLNA